MRLIDADALKRKAQRVATESWKMKMTAKIETVLNQFIDWIDNAPTIQPERKTGRWLPDTNNYYEERFVCSVCGRSYKVDTCMGKPIWDFCPCGADMRGERDE